MKTAAYTILKNEYKFIENWLYYTKNFTYRVLLDTGSTDLSWELLQAHAQTDPNLIIKQQIFAPWRFDVARNVNFAMIPDDVEWCLSPDLDEHFSINTIDVIPQMIEKHPGITNIATTRLDIYSSTVTVGPQTGLAPSNKIHTKAGYHWVQPIYEHLLWKGPGIEHEVYCPDIYLIHNQDFKKPERTELYIKMLLDEYETNPKNTWTLWFLVYHYYKSKQLDKYIPAACDFVKYHDQRHDPKYKEIKQDLINLKQHAQLTNEQRWLIEAVVAEASNV